MKLKSDLITKKISVKDEKKHKKAEITDENSKDLSKEVRAPILCQKIADGIAAIPATNQAKFSIPIKPSDL